MTTSLGQQFSVPVSMLRTTPVKPCAGACPYLCHHLCRLLRLLLLHHPQHLVVGGAGKDVGLHPDEQPQQAVRQGAAVAQAAAGCGKALLS